MFSLDPAGRSYVPAVSASSPLQHSVQPLYSTDGSPVLHWEGTITPFSRGECIVLDLASPHDTADTRYTEEYAQQRGLFVSALMLQAAGVADNSTENPYR